MRQGDRLELAIEGIDAEGDGFGRLGERRVHVSGAFPAERVIARVEHVSRQNPRVRATLLEVRAPHPSRRTPPCDQSTFAKGRCTGCALMGLEPPAQREVRAALLREALGVPVDRLVFLDGGDEGYRWSSKRVAFGSGERFSLGSFQRGTHRPADMEGCRVEHPALVAAARSLVEVARREGVVAYDERSGTGDLRYVWLKTDGERVLVTLVTAHDRSAAVEALAPRLDVAGIAHSVQGGTGNALRGSGARVLSGIDHLELSLAGVKVDVGPLGFLQPNPRVAELAYRDLVATTAGEPARGKLAFDLYAGAGVTTALLRQGFEEVVPCEAYPESAAQLGVSPMTASDFLGSILAVPDHPLGRPELVVANPPRGGMGAVVTAQLAELRPRRLTIMSCSPMALRRDLDALCGPAGGFALERVVAYDTLPQTPHVEVVAWLRHEGPSLDLASP